MFVYLVTVVIFIIVIIILGAKNEDNVPANGFKVYEKTYPFWTFGLASLFFSFIILSYFCSLRVWYRYTKMI